MAARPRVVMRNATASFSPSRRQIGSAPHAGSAEYNILNTPGRLDDDGLRQLDEATFALIFAQDNLGDDEIHEAFVGWARALPLDPALAAFIDEIDRPEVDAPEFQRLIGAWLDRADERAA